MTIKSKPCKVCESVYHTAMYHKERKPIKRNGIKIKFQKIDKNSVIIPLKKSKRVKSITKSRSQLVKELDSVFSQYIRQKYADEFGNVACVTCGNVLHWKQMQNGHYESRGHLPTRWSEDNCAPQDVACNVFKKGNYTEYAIWMIKTYGADKLDELKARANSGEKIPTTVIKEKIEKYKAKLLT